MLIKAKTTSKKNHLEVHFEVVLISCGGLIRTDDLWVMSPTSYHCSTPRCRVVIFSITGAKVR